MSSPLDPRVFDANARGISSTQQVRQLQRDVAALQRDKATGSRAEGFTMDQPDMPASGVLFSNDTGKTCAVYIRGGTITGLTIGGVGIGFISGTFMLPPGETIAITYSVAPIWFWYGL
jgi:hypothetical protein